MPTRPSVMRTAALNELGKTQTRLRPACVNRRIPPLPEPQRGGQWPQSMNRFSAPLPASLLVSVPVSSSVPFAGGTRPARARVLLT